ncbi:MAG: EAL and HDOD domain-containing protein [Chloroflexota bacterium]
MSVYVARSPIFNQAMDTFGYELVYNSGSPDRTGQTSTSPVGFCFETDQPLAGGRSLIIGGDPRDLARSLAQSNRADNTVVTIPASLEVSGDVMDAAHKLEQLGARLVIDGINTTHLHHALLDLASFVRLNAAQDWDEVAKTARSLAGSHLELMASHVDTEETFNDLKDLGVNYFAGGFLSSAPEHSSTELPSLATSRLLLLREINQPDLDIDSLARVIGTDVAMTYRLLRLVNSAAIGLRQHVTSVKHAAMMLGLNGVRKWAAVLVLQELGSPKSPELMIQSLIRAAFCESIAQRGPLFDRGGELYLLGLFSMIDALLSFPLEAILPQLPLAPDLKAALEGEENEVSRVLDLVTAYENANWPVVDQIAGEFAQHEERIALAYRQAVEAATELAADWLVVEAG